jgi:hypothetical protein
MEVEVEVEEGYFGMKAMMIAAIKMLASAISKKKTQPEPHQLIIAETGQGPAHPDEEDQQGTDLGEEDEDVEETAENSTPAA